ncbi:hypothetical protein BKA82DRAFT_4219765 [Pisolithus tinctorius]|nr:hypothetical protein BKA82DRAFT_4219765 [Pisolithus tinctorius]
MERRGRQDERYQSLRAMFYFMYHTKNVYLFTHYRSTSVARTAPSLYRTGSCPLCLWDGFTIAEYMVDKESGSMSFFLLMHPSSALCVVFAIATRLPALAHLQRLIPRGHIYIYSPRLTKTWGICRLKRQLIQESTLVHDHSQPPLVCRRYFTSQ